ncbi:MAG: hypothetical protein ACREDR_13545 [Blastocatellia bacterium]
MFGWRDEAVDREFSTWWVNPEYVTATDGQDQWSDHKVISLVKRTADLEILMAAKQTRLTTRTVSSEGVEAVTIPV